MNELQKVERAAALAAAARGELEVAIREAHASKRASLRDIAQAAGISHEQVRRILAK